MRSSNRLGLFAKLITLGSLYVSQAIPLGFFIIAVPTILRREGVSLEKIGLLSALALPWLIKFLWAPLVDRWGVDSRFGHYRSWILPLQIGCVGTVACMANLNRAADMGTLIVLGGVFMLLSATQDIATDGLAVRLLEPHERGLGNGAQVGGYYLGQILGGGVVLLLFGRFGWTIAISAMAVFLALPIIPLLSIRESARSGQSTRQRTAVGYRSLLGFFRQTGVRSWIVVVLLWRGGETMVQWMFNPMLVDRGFSPERIGLILGVAGSIGALGGAVVGGLLISRWGRRKSLLAFGGIQAMALALYILLAREVGGLSLIYGVVIASAAAGGMATAALYTRMMDVSRYDSAASDFTVQQSLAAIGPLIAAGLSGFSATAIGYSGHFMLAVRVQVLAVLCVAWAVTPARSQAAGKVMVQPS